jgi:hypothetical protein
VWAGAHGLDVEFEFEFEFKKRIWNAIQHSTVLNGAHGLDLELKNALGA